MTQPFKIAVIKNMLSTQITIFLKYHYFQFIIYFQYTFIFLFKSKCKILSAYVKHLVKASLQSILQMLFRPFYSLYLLICCKLRPIFVKILIRSANIVILTEALHHVTKCIARNPLAYCNISYITV